MTRSIHRGDEPATPKGPKVVRAVIPGGFVKAHSEGRASSVRKEPTSARTDELLDVAACRGSMDDGWNHGEPDEPASLAEPPPEATDRWLARHAAMPMETGSVLFHAPSQVFQAPGGGENQLVQTARHLEAQGIAVRPFVPWTDRLEQARLIHLFGMSREGLELAHVARRRRLPIVLSPICWFEPSWTGFRGLSWRSRLRNMFGAHVRRVSPIAFGWRAELLAVADAILPNSRAEASQLVRVFGADRMRVTVVPNGVDPRFADADPAPFRDESGLSDFVLYVGRIEPRKNVLGLIKAVRITGHPLVIIGDVVPGHEMYGERCRREGRGFTRWIPRLEHEDPRLASAYAAAKVFALPSYFETPGLAALEAALSGRPVVITPRGATREYFGEWVRYARPERTREIAREIRAAWEQGAPDGLSRHVARNYLWATIARRTAEVYDQIAP